MATLICKPLAPLGGDGTEGKPFGDLQLAHDRAAAGDTLRLLAGTYPKPPRATALRITKPLSVEADVGAELDVQGCSNGIVVDGRDVGAFSDVFISGVRLLGDVSYCHIHFHTVSDFAVRHCNITGKAGYGLLVLGDCADFVIRRNRFEGQARNLCIGEHIPRTVGPHRFVVRRNLLDYAAGGGNGDGLQILGNCTVDGRIEANTIRNPSDDAMDIGNGARRILVRGNTLQCDPAAVGDGVGLKVGTREREMQFPCSVLTVGNTITGAKTHAMELTGASRPGETARSLLISVGNTYAAALKHDTGFVEAADIITAGDTWEAPPLPYAALRLRDGQGTGSPSRKLFEGGSMMPNFEELAKAHPEWAEDLAWASRELARGRVEPPVRGRGRQPMKTVYRNLGDNLDEHELHAIPCSVGSRVIAVYRYACYEGSAVAIWLEPDGRTMQCGGGHNSCYGMDEGWEKAAPLNVDNAISGFPFDTEIAQLALDSLKQSGWPTGEAEGATP